MGNRLTASSVTATSTSSTSYQPNRLNQISDTSTAYTGGGTDASSARIYDADGNLTDVKTSTSSGVTSHTQYVYDDANRLTDVITHDPATDANVHKSTFTIDGFSRVLMSTESNWNGTSWVKQSQKHYVYDGMDPYVELGDSASNITKILLRGGNGEILVEPLEATWDFRYYYHDGSGNVSDVVDLSVATYTSLGHYDYDAYGNLTGSSGSDPDANYYRYSGKEYIPSVGMYNYGYRFYSPGMGRWINRDPIGENGGLNLYGFVDNNPINAGDAYGLWKVAEPGTWFDGKGYQGSGLLFDQSSACNLKSDLQRGWYAGVDGLNPFGDWNYDLGYYKESDVGAQGSFAWGQVSQQSLITAGSLGISKLYTVPKYLYHFTSAEGGAAINESGILRVGTRNLYGKGVYLTRYTTPIIAKVQGARETSAVVRVATEGLNIKPTIFPGTFRAIGDVILK